MSVEVKVPALPESIADAVIAQWHKQAGEAVRRDENLVDLETDKVILEVPAVTDGVLTEIRFEQGSTVTADQVLAVIDENAEAGVAPAGQQTPASENAAAAVVPPRSETETADSTQETPAAAAVSPSARKLMEENDIAESSVRGSGKGGRVLKEDVLAYIRQQEAEQDKETVVYRPTDKRNREPVPSPSETTATLIKEQSVVLPGDRIEKRVPMTRLRARIAERLLEAQHNAAILTTFNEVNMKPIMDIRKRYREKFEQAHGVKLGFMSFFVSAAVEALKKFPEVNASIDGEDIVYHGYYDIGVAVSGPSGLVVPVLRSAEALSLAEIEKAIIEFANKARDNSLSINDITGGTFTISNGGIFGSMMSTPILNPPQSAILGMHTIKDRPMAVDGELVILPMMYLALSYDHRIIDGREAVQFLVTIKDMLEDPSRMLLGI